MKCIKYANVEKLLANPNKNNIGWDTSHDGLLIQIYVYIYTLYVHSKIDKVLIHCINQKLYTNYTQ